MQATSFCKADATYWPDHAAMRKNILASPSRLFLTFIIASPT
jgi:hypothetical protein